jgi:plastocyanin
MFKLRLVSAVSSVFLGAAAIAAPLELHVLTVDGKGAAGTVIVLRSTDPARPLARPVDTTMDQINLQFAPHVLIVPRGSKVIFPNKDTVQHQVYSNSRAHQFELELYRGMPKKKDPEIFDQAGVVSVNCNIHDSMRAYIFVVEAQYFGRADASGTWKADVQPGTYSVQVWHPLARDMRPVIDQKITVTAADSKLSLNIAAKLKLRSDSQIPANWDAY